MDSQQRSSSSSDDDDDNNLNLLFDQEASPDNDEDGNSNSLRTASIPQETDPDEEPEIEDDGTSSLNSQSTEETTNTEPTDVVTPSHEQCITRSSTWAQEILQEITKEHHNGMKLYLIVNKVGRLVMKAVFDAGAKYKQPNETLKEYLFRYKKMTNADYRKIFNRTQRDAIESDCSCVSFDISLFLPAIQQGCDGLSSPGDNEWLNPHTLENDLKSIKDFRNNVFHGNYSLSTSEFVTKIEEIRTLLLECLSKAEEKFTLDHSSMEQKRNDTNACINYIRDNPLNVVDLNMYDASPLFLSLQNILLSKGYQDMEVRFLGQNSSVNPASTILGEEFHMNINAIFTPLEMLQSGRREMNVIIQYNDLIYEAHKKKQRDGTCLGQIILLEGVAGSGKTTLIKKLVSDWASNQQNVREIDFYKFIIPIECRSRSYTKLSDVISSLMPKARQSFRDDKHMEKCVLSLPSIIVFDGLDELNSVTQDLFSEIMEIKNSENLTIICTTRPEKTQDFYHRLPDDVNIMRINIMGIAEENIEKFISKYHDALRDCGKSEQSTLELLHYYRTRGMRLKHLFRCPLYASLLCIMWAIAPDVINNITTETELLLQITELSMNKLLERLTKHDMTKQLDIHSLKKKLEEFKEFLCKIALHCLRDDEVIIGDDRIQSLERKCNDLQLPRDEVLGAFLNCENSWTSTSMKSQLSFPHKSLQDFYAALSIYGNVISNDTSANVEKCRKEMHEFVSSRKLPVHIRQRIIESNMRELQQYEDEVSSSSDERNILESILSEALEVDLSSLNLNKLQNMLQMLIGILYHYGFDINDKLANELVNLLRRSGVTKREQFVQVLNSVKCNDSLVRLIAKIPGIMEGFINVGSANTFAYASLFKITKPESVEIEIYDDPLLVPRLDELILTLSNHQSQVNKLQLEYLFHHPEVSLEETQLGNSIEQMMKKCHVEIYEGSLNIKGLELPDSLRYLCVSIRDEETYQIFNSFQQSHPLIDLLVVLEADVTLGKMSPLREPRGYLPSLYLLNVKEENIQNVIQILKSLNPIDGSKKFTSIYFPRINLNIQQLLTMIKLMGKTEGRMEGRKEGRTEGRTEGRREEMREERRMEIQSDVLHFPSSLRPTEEEEVREIEREAEEKLGCHYVRWKDDLDEW